MSTLPPEESSVPIPPAVAEFALLQQLRTVSTVEEIDALPVGSVLLCKVGEVFWKATTAGGGVWLAAGYTDTWTGAEVSEWAPLRVLHRGGEGS